MRNGICMLHANSIAVYSIYIIYIYCIRMIIVFIATVRAAAPVLPISLSNFLLDQKDTINYFKYIYKTITCIINNLIVQKCSVIQVFQGP